MKPDIKVQIRRQGGQYTLVAPRYGIVVRTSDLNTGFNELDTRATDVRNDLIAEGVDLDQQMPVSDREDRWLGIVVPIIATVLAPWLAIGLLLFIVLTPVVNALNGIKDVAIAAREASQGNIAQVGRGGANWIIRTGDTVEQLSPERKTELRGAVHKIVQVLKPLADEVRPLFVEPQAKPGEPGASN